MIEHDPVLAAALRRRARDTYLHSERIEHGDIAGLADALRALTSIAETTRTAHADLKARVDFIESVLVDIGRMKIATA